MSLENRNLYVKSDQGHKIIIMNCNRSSLRYRQRNKNLNGKKTKPLKFVSFQEMVKIYKRNPDRVIGPFTYNHTSKL